MGKTKEESTEIIEQLAKLTVLDRIAQSIEIAKSVLFLASDDNVNCAIFFYPPQQPFEEIHIIFIRGSISVISDSSSTNLIDKVFF